MFEIMNAIKTHIETFTKGALCFDKSGNRLGYGKGYYDRYLQNHSLISFGLCYNRLIIDYVVNDAYDKRVDFVVSEKRIITCNGGQNG